VLQGGVPEGRGGEAELGQQDCGGRHHGGQEVQQVVLQQGHLGYVAAQRLQPTQAPLILKSSV